MISILLFFLSIIVCARLIEYISDDLNEHTDIRSEMSFSCNVWLFRFLFSPWSLQWSNKTSMSYAKSYLLATILLFDIDLIIIYIACSSINSYSNIIDNIVHSPYIYWSAEAADLFHVVNQAANFVIILAGFIFSNCLFVSLFYFFQFLSLSIAYKYLLIVFGFYPISIMLISASSQFILFKSLFVNLYPLCATGPLGSTQGLQVVV
jgi:hypothetical protein